MNAFQAIAINCRLSEDVVRRAFSHKPVYYKTAARIALNLDISPNAFNCVCGPALYRPVKGLDPYRAIEKNACVSWRTLRTAFAGRPITLITALKIVDATGVPLSAFNVALV